MKHISSYMISFAIWRCIGWKIRLKNRALQKTFGTCSEWNCIFEDSAMQNSHKKFKTDIKRITKNWTSGTEDSLPVPHILEVIGPKQCGKTTSVLTAIPDCIYFSFRNFTEREALRVFCEQVAPVAVYSPDLDWAAAFSFLNTKQGCIIVLDDVTAACASESFFRGCKSFASASGSNCLIVISENSVFSGSNIPTKILRLDYFGLADIQKLLKQMNYRAVFRVLTATGGIPELCNLFVGSSSFKEALSEIISLRSPMIRFAPEYMETLFRNPEMYHAILRAVAIGHTRNSQIAARIGEPNNKCDKYCQVLINHKILENHNHNYRFVNSFFELWYAVFYESTRGLYRKESKVELIEALVK